PTRTDLANLARCACRVYLDAAGDPAEKLYASAFLELLWESGPEQEAMREPMGHSWDTQVQVSSRVNNGPPLLSAISKYI
ncbi:MAG TPA: hypothetical protein PLV66_04045, partial [Thermoanaerobaculales bacterium]|nr:hypothetical protein [Thermoanaerobaculales bacterium]